MTIAGQNDAPFIVSAISDTTLNEDFGTAPIVDLLTVFDDIDLGDSLSYVVNTAFGLVTTNFTGTTLELISVKDANGLDSIFVTATDQGFASVSDTFLVDVTNTNDGPAIAAAINSATIFPSNLSQTGRIASRHCSSS